jgi:hypothetical protein
LDAVLERYAMVCGAGHSADVVHIFLMTIRPVEGIDMFHARSLYVWYSKSDVGKCAACSTSLEPILINVGLGRP